MKVGSPVKCRDVPDPPADNGYLFITDPKSDVHIGEEFLFQCKRGEWRPEDNSTEPFGFPCTLGNYTFTMQADMLAMLDITLLYNTQTSLSPQHNPKLHCSRRYVLSMSDVCLVD